MSREVVVLSAVRSAIGSFGGSLADFETSELAGIVMKEAVARSNVDPQQINYVTVGTTMPTDSRYAYASRVASIQAGLPMESVAMQVSRLCASGLQGIVTTAQNIMLSDADYGIGGGVEVMSKAAYLMPALRSGARMGDTKAVDSMVAVLTDPFGVGHMGITAENLAAKHGITREQQDEFAAESQRRAAAAQDAGRFVDEIVGGAGNNVVSINIPVKTNQYTRTVTTGCTNAHTIPIYEPAYFDLKSFFASFQISSLFCQSSIGSTVILS